MHTSTHIHTQYVYCDFYFYSLIASMLQVDVNARASMDQIFHHPWLAQSQSVTTPMPLLSTLSEITPEDKDFVLHRMEQGNFGSRDSILK